MVKVQMAIENFSVNFKPTLRVIISSLREGREMRKAISGIMLLLLLMFSMLTLALNIQQAKSQQSTTLKIVDAATGS